jgi:hypothetical protein fuD12_10862
MSPRTGRPRSDNPRDQKLNLRLRQDELDLIQECAKKLSETRVNAIMKGIYLLKSMLDKKKE